MVGSLLRLRIQPCVFLAVVAMSSLGQVRLCHISMLFKPITLRKHARQVRRSKMRSMRRGSDGGPAI